MARILIADGEEKFVRQAAATLHLSGYEVSSCQTVEEAMRAASTQEAAEWRVEAALRQREAELLRDENNALEQRLREQTRAAEIARADADDAKAALAATHAARGERRRLAASFGAWGRAGALAPRLRAAADDGARARVEASTLAAELRGCEVQQRRCEQPRRRARTLRAMRQSPRWEA